MEAPRTPQMPPPMAPAPVMKPPPNPNPTALGTLPATVPVQAVSTGPAAPPQATVPVGGLSAPPPSPPSRPSPGATVPVQAVPLAPSSPPPPSAPQATVAAPTPVIPAGGRSYSPPSGNFAPPPQVMSGFSPPQPVAPPPAPSAGMPPVVGAVGPLPGMAFPPPAVMPPPAPPVSSPPKKSQVGLVVLISGVVLVGVLLVGFLGALLLGSWSASNNSKSGEKPPVAGKPTSRGEAKIFENYLSKVELSYLDKAPKNDDDITFDPDHKGTSFPKDIGALVLRLVGDPPSGTKLNVIWTKSGREIQKHENVTLQNGSELKLSIYKSDGSAVSDGSYQVEVKDGNGQVAARVTFYVGD